MKNKGYVPKVLLFFIRSSLSPFLKYQIFSEIFFNKLVENPSFSLLILKLISKENGGSDLTLNSSIFFKNTILLGGTIIDKNIASKLFPNLISVTFSLPLRISQQFSEFIPNFVMRNYHPSQIFFLLKNIATRLDSKLNLLNKGEYFILILSSFFGLFFCSIKKNEESSEFFLILEEMDRILYKFGEIFFDIHPFFFGNSHLIYISEICLNLKKIQSHQIGKKTIFNLKNWMILLISLSYSPFRKKNFFKREHLHILDSIYEFVKDIFLKYEEDVILFVPPFCWLAFKLLLQEKIFGQSFFPFILSILSSSQSKIFSKDHRSFFFFLSLFYKLLLVGFFSNLPFFSTIKFISYKGKWGYLERSKFAHKLSVPFRILRENFYSQFLVQLKLKKGDISEIDYKDLQYLSIILKVNGDSLKGNRVTLFIPSLPKFFFSLSKNFIENQKSQIWSKFFDFFTLFRYQIPLKSLVQIFFFFLGNSEEKKLTNFHSLFWFERTFCLRGNDGFGTLMFEPEDQKKILVSRFLNSVLLKKITTECPFYVFKKLLLRLIGNRFLGKEFFHFSSSVDFKVLEFLSKNCQNELSIRYTMEFLLFFLFSSYPIKATLFYDIFQFGSAVITQEISQLIPYLFDIFSSPLILRKDKIFQDFLEKLFLGILNPHVWIIRNLQKPMLRFVRKYMEEETLNLNKKTLASVMTLFQYLFFCIKDTEIVFEILKIILEKKNFNFIPRIMEVTIEVIQNTNSINFIFQTIILIIDLIGKKGMLFFQKNVNQLRQNLISFLINIFCSGFKDFNSFVFTNLSIEKTLKFFEENFCDSFLKWIQNLKNVFFRKILYDLKITEDYNKRRFNEGKESRIKTPLSKKTNWNFDQFQTCLILRRIGALI